MIFQYAIFSLFTPSGGTLKKKKANKQLSFTLHIQIVSISSISITSTGTHKDTIEAAKQKHLNSQGVLFYESNLSSYVIQKIVFSLGLKPGDFFSCLYISV